MLAFELRRTPFYLMLGDLEKILYEIYLMYWDAACYESKYIDVPSDDNFLLCEGCNDAA